MTSFTITIDHSPTNQTRFKRGAVIGFKQMLVRLLVVGEDSTYLHTFIMNGDGRYYGILKHPNNLGCLVDEALIGVEFTPDIQPARAFMAADVLTFAGEPKPSRNRTIRVPADRRCACTPIEQRRLAACNCGVVEHPQERGAEGVTESESDDRIADLESVLCQVAQSHAWLAFGECRGIDDARVLPPAEADALARSVLGLFNPVGGLKRKAELKP